MSDDSKRRRGGASRYLNGGANSLMGPSEPDDRFWTYSPAQLLRMDARFVARLERAFRLGREQRSSASACVRPGAGDSDRLSLAS